MIIEILFLIIALYLLCGCIFAFPFLMKGVSAIDENAVNSGLGFRLIIIPGVVVFWPFLLRKWRNVKSKRHDKIA